MEFELPYDLQDALEDLVNEISLKKLLLAQQKLTENYRSAHTLFSKEEKVAYLLTRLPATYGVILYLLQELKKRLPSVAIHSFLDLGAGPGTSLWAMKAVYPEASCNLLEKDPEMIELGKKICSLPAVWQKGDLTTCEIAPHDLILLSYVVGELSPSDIPLLIEKAWKSVKQFLIIIEPGTPHGFDRMRIIREKLITLGCHILAPCPHQKTCPIAKNDWCHFSQRIPRTSLHRQMKSGTLSYEDEKFSYLIVSKTPSPSAPRIIRCPQKNPGHITFTLCTESGIQNQTISKKAKENYKKARKLDWGQELMNDPQEK